MKIATLIAKLLVSLAAIAILGGILVLALTIHLITWPYRSTHTARRRPGQLGALLALLTALVALLTALDAKRQARQRPLTMRQWRKRRRELYATRPDDPIPY